MSENLVWANVTRPRTPLVYLDLNTVIYFAKLMRGDTNVPLVQVLAAMFLTKGW